MALWLYKRDLVDKSIEDVNFNGNLPAYETLSTHVLVHLCEIELCVVVVSVATLSPSDLKHEDDDHETISITLKTKNSTFITNLK